MFFAILGAAAVYKVNCLSPSSSKRAMVPTIACRPSSIINIHVPSRPTEMVLMGFLFPEVRIPTLPLLLMLLHQPHHIHAE